MPLLHPAHARGLVSGLPGSLPDRRAQVRHILDPNSEVSHILREKRVFIQLKEEMGTSPRFFYYFDK